MNCLPGQPHSTDGADDCAQEDGGIGGYTYADFGKVLDGPEVHADGEIWGQTLWQLRDALISAHGAVEGLRRARLLITEAMRLSPPDPSYLDERDALLAADTAAHTGDAAAVIWPVFASRGMGWFASTSGGDDVHPVADFSLPPAAPGVTVSGRITDRETGAPVAGAVVGFGGHLSNQASDLKGTSDANGGFTIAAVPPGTYPQVLVHKAGYDAVLAGAVTVGAAGAVLNVQARRDFASVLAGASVTTFTGSDFTQAGCGPAGVADQSQGTGWGSTSDAVQRLVLALPQAVDVSRFEVDPGAVCGDDDTASVGSLRLELSSDGVTFTPALNTTFSAAQNHVMTGFAPAAGAAGARFVRVTMFAPQSRASGRSGSQFMDMAELAVYGTPTATSTAPPPVVTPTPVPAPPAVATRPSGTLTAKTKRLRDLTGKGFQFTVKSSEAVTAAVTLSASRPKFSATLRKALSAGKTTTLTVKLKRSVKRKLRRLKSLKVTVSVKLTDRAGLTTTLRKTLTLRR